MGKGGGQFDPHHQIASLHHKWAFLKSIPLKIKCLATFVFIMFWINPFLEQFWAVFGPFSYLHGYSTSITETSKIIPKMAQNIFFENMMKIKVFRNVIWSGIDLK